MVKDAADSTVDGRRSRRAKTDDKLAATVREQLNDIGFSAMTIEGVCAASGVAKTTVYRRWKSKAEMVFELVLHGAEDEFPDTGSLAGDVRALAEMTVNFTASDMSQKVLPGFWMPSRLTPRCVNDSAMPLSLPPPSTSRNN